MTAEAAEPSDLSKSIRGVPMAYRSQNLGVVVIYHPGTPQDTSGTALDSPGQLVGGLDTSRYWIIDMLI